jgi:hypothetical protein
VADAHAGEIAQLDGLPRTEKAPEMTAWEAITVARVASKIMGIWPKAGTRR